MESSTPLPRSLLRRCSASKFAWTEAARRAGEEAGAGWAGYTLRHTYASLQLSRGVNVVQLSRALGHHSATLDTYVHLLEGTRRRRSTSPTRSAGATLGQRTPTDSDRTPTEAESADTAA